MDIPREANFQALAREFRRHVNRDLDWPWCGAVRNLWIHISIRCRVNIGLVLFLNICGIGPKGRNYKIKRQKNKAIILKSALRWMKFRIRFDSLRLYSPRFFFVVFFLSYSGSRF